jgi:uncharacterized glyoxalase superfamily protein PhnB
MKPPPPGWPRMSASVHYDNPLAAIDWLCEAFGFEARQKVVVEGKLVHSELVLGEAVILMGTANGSEPWQKLQKSPQSVGGVTHALMFYIDDVDAHYAKAVQAGAEIVREPRTDDYGPEYWTDRTYGALDPERHLWWFVQRVRS